jgi:hypothetical protein
LQEIGIRAANFFQKSIYIWENLAIFSHCKKELLGVVETTMSSTVKFIP